MWIRWFPKLLNYSFKTFLFVCVPKTWHHINFLDSFKAMTGKQVLKKVKLTINKTWTDFNKKNTSLKTGSSHTAGSSSCKYTHTVIWVDSQGKKKKENLLSFYFHLVCFIKIHSSVPHHCHFLSNTTLSENALSAQFFYICLCRIC